MSVSAAASTVIPAAFQYIDVTKNDAARSWTATARVYALAGDRPGEASFATWKDAVAAAKLASAGALPGHAVIEVGDGFAISPLRTVDTQLSMNREPNPRTKPPHMGLTAEVNVPFHFGNVRTGAGTTRVAGVDAAVRFIVDHTATAGEQLLVLS